MRYVLAVAETTSFTRAAERCHVAQSALCHQVAWLEKELRARLFERTRRWMRLTTAREAFLPTERAGAEVAAATGEIRGNLTVGSIRTAARTYVRDVACGPRSPATDRCTARQGIRARARWLADHPEVEVICQDRGSTYPEAARAAAPQAVQVAYAWHLWNNLGQ
ncbi:MULTISPECIES: LysR family transcriptional regulator [unclassified Streptomyces]|uniref:LysR family transcriptional regulator n=1 Tax=unclassified Streptomyces TaxID=2593676 RepID=UPI0035DA30E7